jgi:F-type H+-transporting ATPase subunit gamma
MTRSLADLQAHVAGMRQLQSVVNALRGIAAARAAQARAALAATRTCDGLVATALGLATQLADAPPSTPPGPRRRHAVILFGAEHGFVGDLNGRLLDALGGEGPETQIFLAGSRAVAAARERGLQPAWQAAMATQIGAVQGVARGIAEALADAIARGAVTSADMVFTQTGTSGRPAIVRRSLLPLDTARFAPADALAFRPLAHLPPARLIERLTLEYVFTELARAALEAFAGENAARLETMNAAFGHIGERLDGLAAQERQLRQEQITDELLDLVAGAGLG